MSFILTLLQNVYLYSSQYFPVDIGIRLSNGFFNIDSPPSKKKKVNIL